MPRKAGEIEQGTAALQGKPELLVVDEEVATTNADIETQTRDFISKQLCKHYKGEALEDFIIHFLAYVPWVIQLTHITSAHLAPLFPFRHLPRS